MFIRQVKTENGWVRGIQAADPRITAYKGIPFAAPPTGENRWRAPQPCPDWEGGKLPVFVWYVGGGLQVGHPSEMEFDGERLARRGLVVVSVNYRLNAFGFLCHPEITAQQPDAPANFGNLDQQAGTRWVKRNIAAFGGDPDNITIGGQSAGGGSVMNQLTCPQNEGLFQRAIVESGVSGNVYPSNWRFGRRRSLQDAEQEGVKFFDFLGVKTLAEARAIDEKQLIQKIKEYRSFWGTVEDGCFCTGDAMQLFMENKRVMCPVMWGRTSSEFFVSPQEETKEAFVQMCKDTFGEDADAFLSLFDLEHDSIEEIRKKATVPSIDLAIRAASAQCLREHPESRLYYYVFDAEIPGWDNAGTFHSVDLWFFFETLAKCWRPFVGKHYDLARQMCNYWAYFIKNGDPNGLDATGEPMPAWDAYTPENNACMVFGDKCVQSTEKPDPKMEILIRTYLKKRGF